MLRAATDPDLGGWSRRREQLAELDELTTFLRDGVNAYAKQMRTLAAELWPQQTAELMTVTGPALTVRQRQHRDYVLSLAADRQMEPLEVLRQLFRGLVEPTEQDRADYDAVGAALRAGVSA